jgi:hypothetical protein
MPTHTTRRSSRTLSQALLPGALLAVSGAPAMAGLEDAGSGVYAHAAMLRAEAAEYQQFDPSEDGPTNLSAEVLLQTRYLFNTRSSPIGPNNENLTVGFDIPRAQVRLSGNLINRQLTGQLTFDFGDAEGDRGRGRLPSVDSGNGSPQLRDAFVQYNFEGSREGMYLKVGQFRSSVITEDAIAPEYQLAVERSVNNEFFALGLTQGIALGRVTDRFAWEVSVNDGHRYWGNPEPANTAFNNAFESDWAFSGRFDWKVAGDWARFADFTSWRGSDEGLKFGAGFHIQRQGDTNPDQIPADFFLFPAQEVLVANWSADMQWENDGWALFVGYNGHRIMWEINNNQLTTVQHGLVIQGSVFVSDQVELFGRLDGVQIDSVLLDPSGVNGFPTGEDTYYYYTVGANWYVIPESHAVKFTADVVFTRSNSDTFDIGAGGQNSTFYPDATVTGLLGGADQEVVLRGQMQILF